MKISEDALLEQLAGKEDWTPADTLAETFRVTRRTVRNYVRRINDSRGDATIESSRLGYRLRAGAPVSAQPRRDDRVSAAPGTERPDVIVRRLIGARDPLSIYDLAEDLHVSDSTLQADLKRVREAIAPFSLGIAHHRDLIWLDGAERDKRRLIGSLISSGNPADFVALAGESLLEEGYDSALLLRRASTVLATYGLETNDYGLNNIVLHLAITIDRLRQSCLMPDQGDDSPVYGSNAFLAAHDILVDLSDVYGFEAPRTEAYYLALIISSNSVDATGSSVPAESISELIGTKGVDLTCDIVGALEESYQLEPFDDDFLTRMAIHLHGLLRRGRSGAFVHNPLTGKTKQTYPLVYDMAVFLANELFDRIGISLNEDEITFLAFHIGGYFENNMADPDVVTCAFLYASYHGLHRSFLSYIDRTFGDKVAMTHVASVSEVDPASLHADIVFSPMPIEAPPAAKLVVLNPMLTGEDADKIRTAVSEVRRRRRCERVSALLRRFLSPELFKRDLPAANATEVIRTLTAECRDKGLCGDDFCRNVLEREQMSSTAFGNQVAVPHSMRGGAYRPFLSLVINARPIPWGDQRVNLVLLIGTSEDDRSSFRTLYESLLDILSEPINASRLISCRTYDEFVDRLEAMAAEGAEPTRTW